METGKKAWVKLGVVLWNLRNIEEYGAHGEWLPFLKSVNLNQTKARDCQVAARLFMNEAGIMAKSEKVTNVHCRQALNLLETNCAEMHNFIESIDMSVVRRQTTSQPVMTGSLLDLRPQFSKLIGKARLYVMDCETWSEAVKVLSVDMLQQIDDEIKAMSATIEIKSSQEKLTGTEQLYELIESNKC